MHERTHLWLGQVFEANACGAAGWRVLLLKVRLLTIRHLSTISHTLYICGGTRLANKCLAARQPAVIAAVSLQVWQGRHT